MQITNKSSERARTTNYVCNQCGAELKGTQTCARCNTDLAKEIETGHLARAYDVTPRRVRYVKEALSYHDRPREMLDLLKRSGVDLAKARLLIDVGCGPNLVRHVVAAEYPNVKVIGFDQYVLDGNLDIQPIDLENAKLPYKDGEVDVAICSHVLEHVENAHRLTDELCRVARNVVILLPNSILWTTLGKVALRRSLLPMVGLGLEKPSDRHRWIYTVGEATRWIRHVAGKWDRNLDIQYRTDWRLPTFMGRIHQDLFVLEMSFVLTSRG